ncbi:A disintegrin and metalloproteinase with thrombospondin motifs 8-like [Conger conger]|uniref:A disintegrin and metalloproteinase with thrombospondin motifs 8-like n=1 Tax=Conger conger TaxID=82655 RepID=UPI002A5AD111|nr:A disintegrin and metalloproteinase with thrombospondin motifs 8-like [Conger conger]
MCSALHITLLTLSIYSIARSELLESEDIIPIRVTSRRNGGRPWKRDQELSFSLTAFGKDFTLHLTPDDRFLAPTIRVQRIKSKRLSSLLDAFNTRETGTQSDSNNINDVNHNKDIEEDLKSCFYSGTVDFKQDSLVAVSLCRGIQGSFVTDGDEYLIEPKRSGIGKLKKTIKQLHVIKRRVSTNTRGATTTFDQLKDETYGKSERSAFSFGEMNGQTRNRQKRFVSAARYVETLVVADSSMTRFYGDEIKHYILTLVAMAAQIYKHPSLKNSVSMVVVKVLVVEDEDVGPEISSNGGVTLRNFCNWQQLFNPSSHRHPEHYDTAVLFTRKDICGHQSCDTLGVADVGTMCDPKRSCSVIEDNGLQAAFTLAHELGHVLSMPHDDSKTCEWLFGNQGGHHLMAPFFVHLNKTLPWSPCSALYITEFFDSGHGDCLLDVPGMTVPLPAEVPARAFSLDVQCQQVFGGELEHCPNTSDTDVCSKLWCRERGQLQCLTKNGSLAWADGTPCGSNRTCLNGVCVGAEEVLQPKVVIDGGWGPWGPWGDCSRTCGGGVEFSHRDCTHPEPQDGGRYCEGQRVKYQSCNTRPCGNNKGKSFREEQCEKYNSVGDLDIHGNIRQWIPKYAGVAPRDRCKLFCRVRGGSEFRVFESKVIDGTTCGPDTTSVCVLGQCVKAGCDRVIGSNQRLDKCGVCGGNGSSCRKVTGSMNKAMYGYNDVVTIPAGATNIDVKQRSHRGIKHDGNYLAIKGETGGYILNGNFSVSTVEQDIPVSGAVLKYSGSSTTLERIQSFQQLREAVTIQLLATAGDATPPKIKYTFFIPKDVSFRKHSEKKASLNAIQPFGTSHWVLGEWSDCSKSCGSGWSRRTIDCRDGGGFPSLLCDEQLRPSDIKPCGDLPCPIWQMGPWSSCSRTCGLGQRHRSIHCLDYAGKIVEPKSCDPVKKPKPAAMECLYQDC